MKLYLVLVLLLIPSLTYATPINPYTGSGNWIISNPELIEDQMITVDGDITIDAPDRVSFINCTISFTGILKVVSDNNLFINDTFLGGQDAKVVVEGDQNAFFNSTFSFTGSTSAGISIFHASTTTFQGNTITSEGQGIDIENSDAVIIKNNTILGTSSTPSIKVSSGSGIHIVNNNISNLDQAIVATSVDQLEVVSNRIAGNTTLSTLTAPNLASNQFEDILIDHLFDADICHNNITGLTIEGSNNSLFMENRIQVFSLNQSSYDRFMFNFLNVTTITNSLYDTFTNNTYYWASFTSISDATFTKSSICHINFWMAYNCQFLNISVTIQLYPYGSPFDLENILVFHNSSYNVIDHSQALRIILTENSAYNTISHSNISNMGAGSCTETNILSNDTIGYMYMSDIKAIQVIDCQIATNFHLLSADGGDDFLIESTTIHQMLNVGGFSSAAFINVTASELFIEGDSASFINCSFETVVVYYTSRSTIFDNCSITSVTDAAKRSVYMHNTIYSAIDKGVEQTYHHNDITYLSSEGRGGWYYNNSVHKLIGIPAFHLLNDSINGKVGSSIYFNTSVKYQFDDQPPMNATSGIITYTGLFKQLIVYTTKPNQSMNRYGFVYELDIGKEYVRPIVDFDLLPNYNQSDGIRFTASFIEAYPQTMYLFVDGVEVQTISPVVSATQTFTIPGITLGQHEVMVRVTDTSGNIGEKVKDVIVLDDRAPEVGISTDSRDFYDGENASFTISISEHNSYYWTLYLDDMPIDQGQHTGNLQKKYNIEFDNVGNHTLLLVVGDSTFTSTDVLKFEVIEKPLTTSTSSFIPPSSTSSSSTTLFYFIPGFMALPVLRKIWN